MMDTFYVCAGWLKDNPIIGSCRVERTRGSEVISFQYSSKWLTRFPDFFLGPDVANVSGIQYPQFGRCFGFIEDASPDRWGRKLMDRKEIKKAERQDRRPRTLQKSDCLLGVSDIGRMGGLRFLDEKGVFMCPSDRGSIPLITDIRKLQASIERYETNDMCNEQDFKDLFDAGSSLGGARPKANVRDADGTLWLAKFPSKKDDYDIGAFEMMVHDMAVMSGLSTPPAKAIIIKDKGTVFLSKRFDRTDDGNRVHTASAMNLLGETDGSDNTSSYLDIASVIEAHSANPESDLLELWKRIVFGVCINNTDDHLRNHGFIYDENGNLSLSPVYDVNPNPDKHELSLLMDYESNAVDIERVYQVSEYFRIDAKTALENINQIQTVIKDVLRTGTNKYHISKSDYDYIYPCFREAFHPIISPPWWRT